MHQQTRKTCIRDSGDFKIWQNLQKNRAPRPSASQHFFSVYFSLGGLSGLTGLSTDVCLCKINVYSAKTNPIDNPVGSGWTPVAVVVWLFKKPEPIVRILWMGSRLLRRISVDFDNCWHEIPPTSENIQRGSKTIVINSIIAILHQNVCQKVFNWRPGYRARVIDPPTTGTSPAKSNYFPDETKNEEQILINLILRSRT